MSFGDAISIVVVLGMFWLYGAVIGSVLKGVFKNYTMTVLSIMHVSLFVAIACVLGDMSLLELVEELFDMDFMDGMLLVMLPVVTVFGSNVGQNYRISIERR